MDGERILCPDRLERMLEATRVTHAAGAGGGVCVPPALYGRL